MDILYKDNEILICVKPCGVLSTDEPGGMPELLRHALEDASATVLAVHRLDRVVGGLMVYARTQSAAAALSRQINDRSFLKEYMAVVHGEPEKDEGRMEDLLFRDSSENKTYVVKRMRKGVREAALDYRVLGKTDGLSLVRIRLLTGRTHQIRAQFSSRAMPLVGDRKYGAAGDSGEIALWSCHLHFAHPRTGKPMDFALDPPGGMPWERFGFQGKGVPSVREVPESVPSPTPAASAPGRPSCPYAKKCGGCQMLHLPYERELQIKQNRLNELLRPFGRPEEILGMEEPYHYRNKVHAAFGLDAKGAVISGIYQPASHRIVPAEHCLIEDETAGKIIADIRSLMPEFKMTAYDERRGTGFLRHVLVRRGFATGEVMVVLVMTDPIFKLQKPFLEKLLALHPEITTVVQNVNAEFGPVVLGRQEKVLYGPGYIEDLLSGCRFRISAKSFYQVNPVQTEKLYSLAVSLAGLTGKETVLDAYCGTGTIGITAAKSCRRVLGVEVNKDAVKDAVVNAKINGISNIWFTCADAGDYMAEMAEQKQSCDVVFLDPPRSGSDRKFLSSLIKMRPKKIVYISCGPDTLARDLKILVQGGYRVQRIRPVDMFPHTEHVETVCLLSKLSEAKYSIDVKLDMDELDVTTAETKATYEEIKAYVLNQTGLQVSSLYIAQVKRECGIIERENYNKPKTVDAKQPQCPEEKRKAIEEALKHFGMI